MKFRLATIKDLDKIKACDLHFQFIKNAKFELHNNTTFRWVILEQNNVICALHRSCIFNNIGYLKGIFLSSNYNSTFLPLQLINYALDDLKRQNVKSICTMVPYTSAKRKIMDYFGLYEISKNYMLFLPNRNKISEIIYSVKVPNLSNKVNIDFNVSDEVLKEFDVNEIFCLKSNSAWCYDYSFKCLINFVCYGNTIEFLNFFGNPLPDACVNMVIYIIEKFALPQVEQIRITLPITFLEVYFKLIELGFCLCKSSQLQLKYYKRL